jgi:Lysylphosphatidylglycerol synthase TM region
VRLRRRDLHLVQAELGRAAGNIPGHRPPVTGLDKRLLAERDTIRAVLGRNGRQAAVLTAGRLGFAYGCLLAALRATGAHPRPSLVLLAYSAAGIIALFPVTPGGLGVAEASLSGLLILAGVRGGYAYWPPWPTESPPTGSPSSPGLPPTCSSGAATDIRSPGAIPDGAVGPAPGS